MKIKRPSVYMLNKLNRVIQLCTTEKQLDGAVNYCNLYVDTLFNESQTHWKQYWENESVHKMLAEALTTKRLELKK